MTTPSNKVAIVTGGAGGIGATSASAWGDGFTVVVHGGSVAAAEALVARIEAAGGRAITAQADIADPAQVARMFASAETAFGGVDVLVNNAGIMRLATIGDSDDALFDSQIGVNLKGAFNTLREASRLRAMAAGGSSMSRPALSACCSRPMASTPPPRPRSRP